MTLETQLTNEIRIINRTLHDYGVDAGTKPAWTTVAGTSYITFELRTGRSQRNADIARLLPELSERLSAQRRRPTPVRMLEMPLRFEVEHPDPQPLNWRAATLRIGAGSLKAMFDVRLVEANVWQHTHPLQIIARHVQHLGARLVRVHNPCRRDSPG